MHEPDKTLNSLLFIIVLFWTATPPIVTKPVRTNPKTIFVKVFVPDKTAGFASYAYVLRLPNVSSCVQEIRKPVDRYADHREC